MDDLKKLKADLEEEIMSASQGDNLSGLKNEILNLPKMDVVKEAMSDEMPVGGVDNNLFLKEYQRVDYEVHIKKRDGNLD